MPDTNFAICQPEHTLYLFATCFSFSLNYQLSFLPAHFLENFVIFMIAFYINSNSPIFISNIFSSVYTFYSDIFLIPYFGVITYNDGYWGLIHFVLLIYLDYCQCVSFCYCNLMKHLVPSIFPMFNFFSSSHLFVLPDEC